MLKFLFGTALFILFLLAVRTWLVEQQTMMRGGYYYGEDYSQERHAPAPRRRGGCECGGRTQRQVAVSSPPDRSRGGLLSQIPVNSTTLFSTLVAVFIVVGLCAGALMVADIIDWITGKSRKKTGVAAMNSSSVGVTEPIHERWL